jgi:hypothetical protein
LHFLGISGIIYYKIMVVFQSASGFGTQARTLQRVFTLAGVGFKRIKRKYA